MCVDRSGRGLMFGCMLLGSLMIVAMSSWLNASALAGAAAIQQHLAITVQNYTRDLDTANTNAIAAQGLLPDIQMASYALRASLPIRTRRLADRHVRLRHRGPAADADVDAARQLGAGGPGIRQARLRRCIEQGGKHLAKMRELISDRGPIAARSDAFAASRWR